MEYNDVQSERLLSVRGHKWWKTEAMHVKLCMKIDQNYSL